MGTLPGDRGFDPLGLAKPQEFLQMELDSLDQNKAINAPGAIKGQLATKADVVSTNSLSPYSEVFGLARFRECELMHGRWCMLATLGIVVSEGLTGVSWIDAGKVELAGAQYFNLGMPFDVGTSPGSSSPPCSASSTAATPSSTPRSACTRAGSSTPSALPTPSRWTA